MSYPAVIMDHVQGSGQERGAAMKANQRHTGRRAGRERHPSRAAGHRSHQEHRRAERRLRQQRDPRPVPRRHLEPGAVIDAYVPFSEDERQAKRRPVIVVSAAGRAVTCVPCTSNRRRVHERGAVLVAEWDQAGLQVPTVALTDRLIELDLAAVVARTGALQTGDWTTIRIQLGRHEVSAAA